MGDRGTGFPGMYRPNMSPETVLCCKVFATVITRIRDSFMLIFVVSHHMPRLRKSFATFWTLTRELMFVISFPVTYWSVLLSVSR